MRRSPMPPRRHPLRSYGRGRQYRKVRRWVADRSSGLCEARIDGVCEARGVHAHHILRRSQGGPDEPGNLLWACAACHRHIHENPAWAVLAGFLRRKAA